MKTEYEKGLWTFCKKNLEEPYCDISMAMLFGFNVKYIP